MPYAFDAHVGEGDTGSCIWTDFEDLFAELRSLCLSLSLQQPVHTLKQVFGHTMQVRWNEGAVMFISFVEFDNCKMFNRATSFKLTPFTIRAMPLWHALPTT